MHCVQGIVCTGLPSMAAAHIEALEISDRTWRRRALRTVLCNALRAPCSLKCRNVRLRPGVCRCTCGTCWWFSCPEVRAACERKLLAAWFAQVHLRQMVGGAYSIPNERLFEVVYPERVGVPGLVFACLACVPLAPAPVYAGPGTLQRVSLLLWLHEKEMGSAPRDQWAGVDCWVAPVCERHIASHPVPTPAPAGGHACTHAEHAEPPLERHGAALPQNRYGRGVEGPLTEPWDDVTLGLVMLPATALTS